MTYPNAKAVLDPERHIIPISGKDSLMTALVTTERWPREDYEFVFNDVGAELPETYEWLDKVEAKTGWRIERLGESLPDLISKWKILPSSGRRFCTEHTKIRPLKRYTANTNAVVYYGLRADEPERQGYTENRKNVVIIPRYPLRELGIGLQLVYGVLKAQDLLPPAFFWPTVYERVAEQLTGLGDWKSCLTEHEFRVLFAGRSRSNCYFCFYQRQYEWIWLSEAHPDLFAESVKLEQDCGAEGYTWQQGYTLIELLQRKDAIIDRRAKEICKLITNRLQGSLFVDDADAVMGATSCGLFCGK